jgi:uncharacterized protein YkwD
MRGNTFRRVAVVAVLAGLLGGTMTTAHAGTNDGARDRHKLLKVTNGSRNNHGLRRVDLQEKLSELARQHSARMARAGTIFHTNNPVRYYLKGRSWSWWGENVGMSHSGVWDVHKAFMRSAPHRANVLNRAFTRVAIGTARSDGGALYVTVFFDRP